MKLLQIDSSARAGSITRRLTSKFAEAWKQSHPAGEVIQRDLSTTSLPLITDDWNATRIEPSKWSFSQRHYLAASDTLIEEVLASDVIVIGAPMYNFAISSLLKAWIDQVVRNREDRRVRVKRPPRAVGTSEGCRHHFARRRVREGHAPREVRLSRTLSAPRIELYRPH